MTLKAVLNSRRSSRASVGIGAKIFALVGFCLTLLVLIAGMSIWQMNKIGVEIDGIVERDLPLTSALMGVTTHQLEQAINLEKSFRAAEVMDKHHQAKVDFEKAVANFKKLNGKVEKELGEVNALAKNALENSVNDEERHEFESVLAKSAKLMMEHKNYDHHSTEAFALLKEGELEHALAMLPQIEKEEAELNHSLENLLVEMEGFTEHAAKVASEHEHFALKLLMAVSGIALIIGIGAAFFLVTRSVSRPLKDIVAGLDALNADDLSVDVRIYNHDEIGAVAKAYAQFKESRRKTKQLEADQEQQKLHAEEEKRTLMNSLADDFDATVGGIVETVVSASAGLNTTAQTMAAISEETSNQANSVAAASEEASTNVQTVASATEEMTNSIREINQQVIDASQASKKAVQDVTLTGEQMESLANTADKIGEVVSMISDIAEQTNLLALNATIESARAGEAGKGFAVVATEVKALATETAKATEGISELISEVQTQTKTAVSAISEVVSAIGQLDETSTAIAAAMEEQGATTAEVARNVQQAALGTKEVSANISGVTQASQEAGNASNDVTTAAGELSQQAERMRSEVQRFVEQVRAA